MSDRHGRNERRGRGGRDDRERPRHHRGSRRGRRRVASEGTEPRAGITPRVVDDDRRPRRRHRPARRTTSWAEARDHLDDLRRALLRRGVAVSWFSGDGDHVVARVGGEDGVEVHALILDGAREDMGPAILLQAAFKARFTERMAPAFFVFANDADRALLGAKVYLRRVGADEPMMMMLIERGCLLGRSSAAHLLDEFQLLVREHRIVRDKLRERFPRWICTGDPLAAQLVDEPVAVEC